MKQQQRTRIIPKATTALMIPVLPLGMTRRGPEVPSGLDTSHQKRTIGRRKVNVHGDQRSRRARSVVAIVCHVRPSSLKAV